MPISFGDDLAQEPGSVLDRTAVLVVAPVPLARKNRRDSRGAVNLDRRTRPLWADDCIAELLGDRCDLVGGHGVELQLHVAPPGARHGHQFVDRQVVDHVERAVPLRQRRHIDRIAVGDIDPTDLAVVHQLHGDRRAMTMDGVGELAQRRDVTVVRHRQLMNRVGAMRVGKGRDLGDEGPAPPAARASAGDDSSLAMPSSPTISTPIGAMAMRLATVIGPIFTKRGDARSCQDRSEPADGGEIRQERMAPSIRRSQRQLRPGATVWSNTEGTTKFGVSSFSSTVAAMACAARPSSTR